MLSSLFTLKLLLLLNGGEPPPDDYYSKFKLWHKVGHHFGLLYQAAASRGCGFVTSHCSSMLLTKSYQNLLTINYNLG